MFRNKCFAYIKSNFWIGCDTFIDSRDLEVRFGRLTPDVQKLQKIVAAGDSRECLLTFPKLQKTLPDVEKIALVEKK